jgi:hypothetical protein
MMRLEVYGLCETLMLRAWEVMVLRVLLRSAGVSHSMGLGRLGWWIWL